jgi:hypothetical protein
MAIQRLTRVYDLLKSKGVPNVDCLEMSHVERGRNPTAFAYLGPKGISTLPKSIGQVFDAIGCILEALVVSPPYATKISR